MVLNRLVSSLRQLSIFDQSSMEESEIMLFKNIRWVRVWSQSYTTVCNKFPAALLNARVVLDFRKYSFGDRGFVLLDSWVILPFVVYFMSNRSSLECGSLLVFRSSIDNLRALKVVLVFTFVSPITSKDSPFASELTAKV